MRIYVCTEFLKKFEDHVRLKLPKCIFFPNTVSCNNLHTWKSYFLYRSYILIQHIYLVYSFLGKVLLDVAFLFEWYCMMIDDPVQTKLFLTTTKTSSFLFLFHGPRHLLKYWALICKPVKEPRNRFPARRAGTTTLFVAPARHAT